MSQRISYKMTMAGLALAIAFSVPASAQDADPAVVANLVLQVQQLQDEVRMLRGELEEQSYELENLKRRTELQLSCEGRPIRIALLERDAETAATA